MNGPAVRNLKARALAAVGWGYGGTVARMVLQVGAQAVLARLLGPAEFGVFAALMLVAGVAVIAADWTSAPVIAAKALSAADLAFAFTCQLGGAVLVLVLVFGSFPAYRSTFPTADNLLLAVALMALGSLLTGLAGLSLSLLRRDLRYRAIQQAQIAGYFIGYVVVAIPAALLGLRSAVALALAYAVQAAVNAALLYRAAPHSLRLSFDLASHQPFMRFGLQIMAGNLGNWFAGSCDRLLIARSASAANIGLYNTLLNLMMTPVVQLTATLNTVAFSVAAQADAAGRRSGAAVYISLTALVASMLYAIIATFPQSLVNLMYGPGWLAAAEFVTPFCLIAVTFAVGAAANAILTATGAGSAVAKVQLLSALAVLAVVWFALQHSLLTAAFAVAVVYISRAAVMVVLAIKSVGASMLSAIRGLSTAVAFAALQIVLGRIFWQFVVTGGLVGQLISIMAAISVNTLIAIIFRNYIFSADLLLLMMQIRRRLICRSIR